MASMADSKPDSKIVSQMLKDLPKIPYPDHGIHGINRSQIIKWQKECIAAGYPVCEECGQPISRGRWRTSITQCVRCEKEEVGLYKGQYDPLDGEADNSSLDTD